MTIVVSLDIETTGIDWEKGDRITEISLWLYRDEKPLGSFTKRANPMREVSAKASKLTGLSWSMLKDEPTWDAIGATVHQILAKADIVVGHNSDGFDIPFIQSEQMRLGISESLSKTVDTMTAGRWATANGKLPTLRELAWSLGLEYDQDQAHGAAYDARLTALCFFEGQQRGFYS